MARRRLQLEPLTDARVRELLDGLGDFDPERAARIREAAEGNPLFVEQIVAMRSDGGASILPPTIQALLAERLDRLDPVERAVLEHASVVGKEFTRDHVVELSTSEDGAVGALLRSMRKDLIRPDEGAGAREAASASATR